MKASELDVIFYNCIDAARKLAATGSNDNEREQAKRKLGEEVTKYLAAREQPTDSASVSTEAMKFLHVINTW